MGSYGVRLDCIPVKGASIIVLPSCIYWVDKKKNIVFTQLFNWIILECISEQTKFAEFFAETEWKYQFTWT